MLRIASIAAVAGASLLAANPAFAHAVAGPRVFVATLLVDDPGVADELALPTIQYQRAGADGGPGPVDQINIGGEFDKRITEDFGVGIADGYNVNSISHGKLQTGFDDLVLIGKYHVYTNDEHEFIASVGVLREMGGTGTLRTGADQYGTTTPTLYAGKGFGDLPIGVLRAFAVTGTFGYSVADRGLKRGIANPTGSQPMISFNNGNENQWVAGVTLQYSIPYLTSQVKDYGLPGWLNRMTPLVEVAYASPASSPSNQGTVFTIAPGVAYSGDTYQFTIEALIPGNKASGTNVGVIGQFHLYLDDLFPNSLGKPLLNF